MTKRLEIIDSMISNKAPMFTATRRRYGLTDQEWNEFDYLSDTRQFNERFMELLEKNRVSRWEKTKVSKTNTYEMKQQLYDLNASLRMSQKTVTDLRKENEQLQTKVAHTEHQLHKLFTPIVNGILAAAVAGMIIGISIILAALTS